jgi:signal transduction histidine kinase
MDNPWHTTSFPDVASATLEPMLSAAMCAMLAAMAKKVFWERQQLSLDCRSNLLDPLLAACLRLEGQLRASATGPNTHEAQGMKSALGAMRMACADLISFDANLFPHILQELGLEAAISVELDQFAVTEPTVHVQASIQIDLALLSHDRQFAIYQFVREAIANTRTHAHAKNIWLNIRSSAQEGITVQFRDDGIGLARLGDPIHLGLGLQTVRALIGDSTGSFKVFSEPAWGTCLLANWPGTATEKPTEHAGLSTRSGPLESTIA